MKSRTKPALRVVPAAQVQLSLSMDGVLRDVRHAFYGLCVNAGKQVLAAMMEADRVALCGAKGVPDAKRRAGRGGHAAGAVVLGGQRIGIKRPRVRSLERGELQLPAYEWAAQRDPLDAATMHAIAAGESTRRYAGALDELPAPDEPLSVSKSAASRRFVALSQAQLNEWLNRSLAELDLPVVMIDGIHFRDRVILAVQGLGIIDALYRTLRTTNPIENLNGSIGHYTRNLKRWKDGAMTLRWVASALSDASGRFRKTARAPRHEDLDGCVGRTRCDSQQHRTRGRVASHQRNRHTDGSTANGTTPRPTVSKTKAAAEEMYSGVTTTVLLLWPWSNSNADHARFQALRSYAMCHKTSTEIRSGLPEAV